MKDILNEENAKVNVTDITHISDEDIVGKMIDFQAQTMEYLRPSVSIIKQTEEEINNVFTYLRGYKQASENYFAKIVGHVGKM